MTHLNQSLRSVHTAAFGGALGSVSPGGYIRFSTRDPP